MNLLDVNVLVYAHREDTGRHTGITGFGWKPPWITQRGALFPSWS
jgi:hypothetical protein